MAIKPTGLNLPVDSKHLTFRIVVVKILCEIVVSEYFFMLFPYEYKKTKKTDVV